MKFKELVECSSDPSKFFEILGVYHVPSNSIIRKPRLYQEDFLKKAGLGKNIFISKPRQVGLTSVLTMYAIWFAFFNTNKKILLVSDNPTSPLRLQRITRVLDDSNPIISFISSEISSLRDGSLNFRNGSEIKSVSSYETGKSRSYDLIICDEFDFFKDPDLVLKSILPSLSFNPKGQLIIGSTPNPISKNSTFEDLIFQKSNIKGECIRILYTYSKYKRYSLGGLYDFSLQESGFFERERELKNIIYKNWLPIEKYKLNDSDEFYLC